jgi:hypothetical protein
MGVGLSAFLGAVLAVYITISMLALGLGVSPGAGRQPKTF